MIKVKRIYDNSEKNDGFRILVDRLWPRGLTKDKARVDLWIKDLAPSDTLRKWYKHDPDKWPEFKRKYYAELKEKKEALALLLKEAGKRNSVTFLFSSREEQLNNAEALKEYVEILLKYKRVA